MAGLFVGREHELDALATLDRRAQEAHAPVAGIVSGEPGSGKTRLLAETLARLPTMRTVHVVGFEPMEPIAFGAVGDLLRHLSAVPGEGARLASIVFGARSDPGSEPLRVFEAAHRALIRLDPVRLAIDDLQWVDRSSLALIHYLLQAAESRRQRLTVIAVGRPSAAVAILRSRIEHQLPPERRVVIEVGPLTRGAGTTLARAIDSRLDDAAAATLWRRAAGSPFWLELLARSSVGDDPTTAIGERLRVLGADAGALLAALSVVGRPISVEDVADLLAWEPRRIDGAAKELVTTGLAVETVGGLRPAHDLIREAALHELPLPDRRRLDARLADAIEREAGGDMVLLREALVHRHAAGRPSAGLALRVVTARQRRLLNVDDLRFLGMISDELEPGTPAQVGLDRGLAELAALVGEQALAGERWSRVATHGADSATRQAAAVEAAWAAYRAGQSSAAHGWLDRAAGEAEVGPEMSIRIDAIRADVYLWVDHRTAAGSEIALRAVETAERMIAAAGGIDRLPIESRRAYLAALEAAADAGLQLDRAAEIVRFGETSVLVAREIDEEAEVAALNRAAFALRPLGRVAEATELSRRAWDQSRRLILPSAMAEAGQTLARSLRDLGRINEAHRVAIETVEIEARLHNPSRRWGNAANVLHTIELYIDDPPGALGRLRDDARRESDPHYRMAIHQTIAEWLARSVGESAEADVAAELGSAHADSSLAGCPRCAAELSLHAADALSRIGRVDEAGAVLNAEPTAVPEGYVTRSLWRARAVASIALARGDYDKAITLLAKMRDALEEAGLLLELVWVWIDLGRANLAVDRDVAVHAFAQAAELAKQIGAVAVGRVAARALRGLGVRTWRRGQSAAGRGLGTLSDREREVARLVADGSSNREVAESLDISPKTVERHVTNMLAKLGIRNRTELSMLVRSGHVRDSPDE